MPNVTFTFDGRSEPFVTIDIPERRVFFRIRPTTRFSCLVDNLSDIHCSVSGPLSDSMTDTICSYANMLTSMTLSGLASSGQSDPNYVNLRVSPVSNPSSGPIIGYSRRGSFQGSLPRDWVWAEGVMNRVGVE
jgi:hypothetical protein